MGIEALREFEMKSEQPDEGQFKIELGPDVGPEPEESAPGVGREEFVSEAIDLPDAPDPPETGDLDRVLVVDDDAPTLRLIREALSAFMFCDVDTTPNAEYGFELALRREYRLFIFRKAMSALRGDLLHSLIGVAYTHCHAGARAAPGTLFLMDSREASLPDEILSDARFKGVLVKPINIERLLQRAGTVLRRRPKPARGR